MKIFCGLPVGRHWNFLFVMLSESVGLCVRLCVELCGELCVRLS